MNFSYLLGNVVWLLDSKYLVFMLFMLVLEKLLFIGMFVKFVKVEWVFFGNYIEKMNYCFDGVGYVLSGFL